jgi:hypothetical protein
MKSKRRKTALSMLMMVAGAASLAACAMGVDADKEARSEQRVLTADEPTLDNSMATEQAVSASGTGLAAGGVASTAGPADGGAITPRVACRLVTAAAINVWSAPNGGFVRCQFFRNDRFSHFGRVVSSNRYITWCPRGVPPSQGTTSYADGAGTVDGGCPP